MATYAPDAVTTSTPQHRFGVKTICLFVSSGYDSGSRVLRLSQQDGETTVEELWFSADMKIQHGTAVRLDKMVYGSSGRSSPAFLMAANVETGEMTAKQRGFAKANVVAVGTDLIVLDEDGTLGLVTPVADGFEVHAQAQIFSARSVDSSHSCRHHALRPKSERNYGVITRPQQLSTRARGREITFPPCHVMMAFQITAQGQRSSYRTNADGGRRTDLPASESR